MLCYHGSHGLNMQGVYINQGSNHSERLSVYVFKNGNVVGPNNHSEHKSNFCKFYVSKIKTYKIEEKCNRRRTMFSAVHLFLLL